MAGPIMEKIGRKKTLLWVSTFNYALGFILILVANNTIFIYIGRLVIHLFINSFVLILIANNTIFIYTSRLVVH